MKKKLTPFAQLKKGFQGIAGYRYHPTKGFKKDSTFRPLSAKEIAELAARTPMGSV